MGFARHRSAIAIDEHDIDQFGPLKQRGPQETLNGVGIQILKCRFRGQPAGYPVDPGELTFDRRRRPYRHRLRLAAEFLHRRGEHQYKEQERPDDKLSSKRLGLDFQHRKFGRNLSRISHAYRPSKGSAIPACAKPPARRTQLSQRPHGRPPGSGS